MLYFLLTIAVVLGAGFAALLPFYALLFSAEWALQLAAGFTTHMLGLRDTWLKFIAFMFKNLRRNLLRTSLAYLVIFVLVVVLVGTWSILAFLDVVTSEKSKDVKAIVTERWQIPSQMPFAYAHSLSQGAPEKEGDVVIPDKDSMTWQFYGGYIVKEKQQQTRDTLVFFFAMEPKKVLSLDENGKYTSMMDGIEDFTEEEKKAAIAALELMEYNKRAVVIGQDRLKAINKQVGETITIYSLNYRGIDLEVEIIGALPSGRLGQMGVMNRAYLNDALEAYPSTHKGQKHPLHDKSLNLVWLRVPRPETFRQVADQIMSSNSYTSPAVKCETAASGISSWLDAYRDLVWGMRWMLAPTVLAIMALIVAIVISIGVRERRTELAVLKVLGFHPHMILFLVLGEALLIGSISGLLSAAFCQILVNQVLGGFKFPIAFFPAFFIAGSAWWWGLTFGATTAMVGSVIPAWSAQRVKVSDVFAKVA
jgi:putative ABC transport system permease protein